MDDPTTLLFGLPHLAVLAVARVDDVTVRVLVEGPRPAAGCPGCGVVTSRVKDRPLVQVRDLPPCGQRVQLWWRKRRLTCRELVCPVRSFTQPSPAIPPRSRLTARLREHLARAVAVSNRAIDEVARVVVQSQGAVRRTGRSGPGPVDAALTHHATTARTAMLRVLAGLDAIPLLTAAGLAERDLEAVRRRLVG